MISGERLFFIDPHERYFLYQGDRTSGYLWHLKERRSELQRIPDQFAPFYDGVCGTTKDVLETGHYPGTLFRFPLRCSPSELSQITYTHEHLEALLSQFEADARLLLIFLKNVECLEVLVRDEHSTEAGLRFRVRLTDECRRSVCRSRRQIVDAISSRSSESFSTTYLIVIETEKYDVSRKVERKTYRYWVNEFFAGGKVSKVLAELRDDPSVSRIPLVGTAVDLDGSGPSTSSKILSPVPTKDDDSSVATERKRPPSGKIFCFLPLAVQEESSTGLPVHVNGYFAISQNRQHLKWPCVGQSIESDKCLLWNHCLIAELIPQSYRDLLASSTHSELFTADDVYAAIPNMVEVDEKWQVGIYTCSYLLLEALA